MIIIKILNLKCQAQQLFQQSQLQHVPAVQIVRLVQPAHQLPSAQQEDDADINSILQANQMVNFLQFFLNIIPQFL